MSRKKYKNAEIDETHLNIIVRRVWHDYFQWQKTWMSVDEEKYKRRRQEVEAIITRRPKWAAKYVLP